MKKVFFSFFVPFFCGIIVAALWTSPAHAAGPKNFPGDGAGDGPALSYTDNADGTFTDDNTKFMWEIKDDAGGVHDKDNLYTWFETFGVFLNILNNKCEGDETTNCTTNADCVGIGNGLCGHAGYRDWRIPNVKELVSIVDYSKANPPFSVPGLTGLSGYLPSPGIPGLSGTWSSTSVTTKGAAAWAVGCVIGPCDPGGEIAGFGEGDVYWNARAVRPCP